MDLNDRLTQNQAVKLITPRVKRSDEETREAENRIRHLIVYAVKKGALTKEKDGNFTFTNLVFWVASKWPGKFNDFHVVGRISITLPMPTMNCNGSTSSLVPQTIEECQSLLSTAQQIIAALENEIATLKPDAEKYRANCKTNKTNAQKNREK